MVIDGRMLAEELRRRRFRHRSMLASLGQVRRSTWVPGELRAAPTDLLVLAAISLTSDPAPARAVPASSKAAGPA